MRNGALLGWLGRGERPLLTFPGPDDPSFSDDATALAKALAERVDRGRERALLVSSIDGGEPSASPVARFFLSAGFVSTSRGLFRRGTSEDASSTDDAAAADL